MNDHDNPGLRFRPTRWAIDSLDDDGTPLVYIDTAGRDGRTFAVRRLAACWSKSGRWDYEPNPSNRTDEWLAEHRFDSLAEAGKAAARAADWFLSIREQARRESEATP